MKSTIKELQAYNEQISKSITASKSEYSKSNLRKLRNSNENKIQTLVNKLNK